MIIIVSQGKIKCWIAFYNADSSEHEVFMKLGLVLLVDRTKNALEQYVHMPVYQPGITIDNLTNTTINRH